MTSVAKRSVPGQQPVGDEGVMFEVLPGQGIDSDCSLESVSADLLCGAWCCRSCGHRIEYETPKLFVEVVQPAMAHQRTCQAIPMEA